MGIVKLQCKSCGAKLPHNNIETDIYGNSKVQCEYCGIFTVLSSARVANGVKAKPYIVVLSISDSKASVRINGLERVVNSEDLKEALLNDTASFDILSRAKIAKVFNIDLDEIAAKELEHRRQDIKYNRESVGDFLAELSKLSETEEK